MIPAFVSLGSNLGDPKTFLAQARKALSDLEGIHIIAESPVYSTEPQGIKDQNWFFNQVIELACSSDWQPELLVERFLVVESRLGRLRSADPELRNGPRCIDIDLLLFGDIRSFSSTCQLPHPRMHTRAFVLVPLQDIAPEVSIDGTKVKDLLQKLVYSVKGMRILQ